MKRPLTVILLLLLCVNLGAFDWPFQSNSELRGEMLEFAGSMAARQKGTAEGRLISRFVRKEARKAAKDSLAWISDTYELTMKLKEMCPPHVDDGSRAAALRRDIMLLEDYPIHVDNRSANASEELKKAFDVFSDRYRSEARAKALEWLEGPGPAEGELQVIKIYNMGYLLRTAQRMIVVDVFWDGTEEEAARIASKADAFFLSHPHRDHWNPVMVDALDAAGATLVLPADICPMHGNKLVADSEWREPRDVRGIEVQLLRGNQGPQPNNAYLIEFDGWRVGAHHRVGARLPNRGLKRDRPNALPVSHCERAENLRLVLVANHVVCSRPSARLGLILLDRSDADSLFSVIDRECRRCLVYSVDCRREHNIHTCARIGLRRLVRRGRNIQSSVVAVISIVAISAVLRADVERGEISAVLQSDRHGRKRETA